MRNVLEVPYESFSIYAIDRATGMPAADEGGAGRIESASTIKSPIAALALLRAWQSGHEAGYRFTISPDDITRRATTRFSQPENLPPEVEKTASGWVAPLKTLLRMSIANSCATSANKLIEYVGGRDAINARLGSLGLHSTELIMEVIDFTGPLIEPDASHRVGTTTARDLAMYFHGLESTIANKTDWKTAEEFLNLHRLTERARLFSLQKDQLPPYIDFANKTGSIFNSEVGQAVIVDAGVLSNGNTGGEIAVAASLVAVKDSLRGINASFSQRVASHIDGYLAEK